MYWKVHGKRALFNETDKYFNYARQTKAYKFNITYPLNKPPLSSPIVVGLKSTERLTCRTKEKKEKLNARAHIHTYHLLKCTLYKDMSKRQEKNLGKPMCKSRWWWWWWLLYNVKQKKTECV